jgi:alkylation response protein AidB-like acyl-CoA dehydrogenase
MANAGVSAPKRGQAFRRLGGLPTALLGNAAVPLGLARRALDEVAQLATRKARPGRLRIADQQLFRHDFAVHDAAVRAARAWTRDVATSGELAAERGAVTELDVQRCSQACVYNHRVGSAAVRFAYEWGGSAALRRQGRLGRVLVDMAAATQHQANDPNLMADAGAFMIEPLSTQEDVAGRPLVPTSTAA